METTKQKIHWKPQAKQELALLIEDADEVLYGGGRGGGKTDTGIIWLIEPRYAQEPRYRALVIRRNADDLRDWEDRADYLYAPLRAKSTGKPTEITLPTGAKIRTGHLNDDKAYTKYQGHEYQKILFEELTHIASEDDYEKLIASNRSTIIGLKPKVFATTNADGPGFQWVKKRFNIPDYPTEVVTTIKKVKVIIDGKEQIIERKLVFIPSKLEDNPILMKADPGYQANLESIKDEDLRKAWREGYWGGVPVKGAFYANQISRLHQGGRFKEVPYDEELPVHTVWDLGTGQNLGVGFYQNLMGEVRMIDFWEGSENDGLPQAAKMLQDKPYLYGKHFGPHDLFATEIGTGKTRYETAKKLGIEFEAISENDKMRSAIPNLSVEDGIEQGKLFFGRLYVDKTNCGEWLEKVGKYRQGFDDKKGIWTGKPIHDQSSHAADVHRYAALVWEKMTNDFVEQAESDHWRKKYNQAQNKGTRFS